MTEYCKYIEHKIKGRGSYEIPMFSVSRLSDYSSKIKRKWAENVGEGKKAKNLRIFATIDLFRGYVAAFCFDNELFKRLRCLATV